MPCEDTKILEFNQYIECLIEKIDGGKNNPVKSFTTKVSKHIPSGFSISLFKSIENKYDVYRGKDCIKKFCESWREHAIEIINFMKLKFFKNEVINKRAAGFI